MKLLNVELHGILGHTKTFSDFSLSHLLVIEFDDLSYFAHTNWFIRHDFLSLLKRKIYDIKNKKINLKKQYEKTKKGGVNLLRSSGVSLLRSSGVYFKRSSGVSFSGISSLSSSTSLPINNLGGTPFSTGGSGLTITTGTEISCPTIFTPAMGPLIVMGGNGSRTIMGADSLYGEELKLLLNGSLVVTSSFSSGNYMMQQFIYNEVKEHTGLQLDSILNDFYINNQTTSIGLINTVNDEIRNQNFSQASISNASYFAANIIEENHQTFNSKLAK